MLITVENGVATRVEGDPEHPTTAGFLCTKVARYLERTYSPPRVLYPMKRVGAKGKGIFARITWDEALETIAQRFKAIADSPDGPQAILPYSYAGTMGLVQSASTAGSFIGLAPLCRALVCSAAGAAGYKVTIGGSVGTDMEQFQNARLILLGAPISNIQRHLWPQVVEAAARRRLIAIHPYKGLSAEKCDEICAPTGPDATLALGMMNLSSREPDHEDYCQRFTLDVNC
jgi:anaerobic selenocysteine-containing dehydrogenase